MRYSIRTLQLLMFLGKIVRLKPSFLNSCSCWHGQLKLYEILFGLKYNMAIRSICQKKKCVTLEKVYNTKLKLVV